MHRTILTLILLIPHGSEFWPRTERAKAISRNFTKTIAQAATAKTWQADRAVP